MDKHGPVRLPGDEGLDIGGGDGFKGVLPKRAFRNGDTVNVIDSLAGHTAHGRQLRDEGHPLYSTGIHDRSELGTNVPPQRRVCFFVDIGNVL